MNKQLFYIIASILILVGLIMIVFGLPDQTLIWQMGLLIVGLAMFISFITRWVPEKEDDSTRAEAKGQ